mgnify:CR=1 FL=1
MRVAVNKAKNINRTFWRHTVLYLSSSHSSFNVSLSIARPRDSLIFTLLSLNFKKQVEAVGTPDENGHSYTFTYHGEDGTESMGYGGISIDEHGKLQIISTLGWGIQLLDSFSGV